MSSIAEQTARGYIKAYAEKHHISFEEAKKHAMCEIAKLYLKKD